jgi:hypothetical protein
VSDEPVAAKTIERGERRDRRARGERHDTLVGDGLKAVPLPLYTVAISVASRVPGDLTDE